MSNYKYDENGVGVKEFYTKVIGNGPETVVVIVYRGHHKLEHHFYRPGGETGFKVEQVPNFFHPFVGRELRKKGVARASAELRARAPGVTVVRDQKDETPKEGKVVPETWHHKYGIAG